VIFLFSGFIYQAGFLIFSGFWLLYVVHLSINLMFPIRAYHLNRYKHFGKIIFIICVGLLVPSIIVGTTRYHITGFPPTQCSADADVFFYTLILPTIFVMATGVILISLSFMSIRRARVGVSNLSKELLYAMACM